MTKQDPKSVATDVISSMLSHRMLSHRISPYGSERVAERVVEALSEKGLLADEVFEELVKERDALGNEIEQVRAYERSARSYARSAEIRFAEAEAELADVVADRNRILDAKGRVERQLKADREDWEAAIRQHDVELAEVKAELDAYRKAKQENDERFQLEAAEQRERADKAEAAVRRLISTLNVAEHRLGSIAQDLGLGELVPLADDRRWTDLRIRVGEVVRAEERANRHGECICNTGPGTDGPEEFCPQHGRTYTDVLDLFNRQYDEISDRLKGSEMFKEQYHEQWMLTKNELNALIDEFYALALEWERDAGPGSVAERIWGPQVVSVSFAVNKIREIVQNHSEQNHESHNEEKEVSSND